MSHPTARNLARGMTRRPGMHITPIAKSAVANQGHGVCTRNHGIEPRASITYGRVRKFVDPRSFQRIVAAHQRAAISSGGGSKARGAVGRESAVYHFPRACSGQDDKSQRSFRGTDERRATNSLLRNSSKGGGARLAAWCRASTTARDKARGGGKDHAIHSSRSQDRELKQDLKVVETGNLHAPALSGSDGL